MPKMFLRVSAMCSPSSWSFMSRRSFAEIIASVLPHDELGPDRQLVAGEAHRVPRERLGHAGQLEHHAPRLDDRDPALGRTLAGAHPRLSRLLGHRLVGEDVDPDLAATTDLAGH